MSRAERETLIRWDCEDRTGVMYTADPAQARRWTKLGYPVSVMDAARDGTPRSWSAAGSPGCVRFRRVKDGAIVKRTTGGPNLPVQRQFQGRPGSEAP
jgi:hypothetical protein